VEDKACHKVVRSRPQGASFWTAEAHTSRYLRSSKNVCMLGMRRSILSSLSRIAGHDGDGTELKIVPHSISFLISSASLPEIPGHRPCRCSIVEASVAFIAVVLPSKI